jgi:hypothetical protein
MEMIKLFSKTYLNKAQGLRIFCRLFVTALIVVAALTANDVFAQSPDVQAITVPPTVSNVNGSLTVTYSASFDPTPPTVSSEDTLTNETWSWSSNCSPQSGSGTVTVSYTASVPGSFSSGVSCTVTWSVVNAKTGVPDNPSTVSVSGAGTTICDFSAPGYSVSVSASLSPTSIYWTQSATGSASASISGTTPAAKAEIAECNPAPTYSVAVIGKPSDVSPSASINAQTGQNLTVTAGLNTTPDTYSIVVTATYSWTDPNTGTSYTACGSGTVSETVLPITASFTSQPPSRIPISGSIVNKYTVGVTTVPATLPAGITIAAAVVSTDGTASVSPSSLAGSGSLTLQGTANSTTNPGCLSIQLSVGSNILATSSAFTVSTEPTGVSYSLYETKLDFGFELALAFASESGNESDLGNCLLSEDLTVTHAPDNPPFLSGFKAGTSDYAMTKPIGDKHTWPQAGIDPVLGAGGYCSVSQTLNWKDKVYTGGSGALGSNNYTYTKLLMPSPPTGYYFQSDMSGGYTYSVIELSK